MFYLMLYFWLDFWLNFQSFEHVILGYWRFESRHFDCRCLGYWCFEFRHFSSWCFMNCRLPYRSLICRSLVNRYRMLGCLIHCLLNFWNWFIFWQLVHWFRIPVLVLQIVIKEIKIKSSISPRCFRECKWFVIVTLVLMSMMMVMMIVTVVITSYVTNDFKELPR